LKTAENKIFRNYKEKYKKASKKASVKKMHEKLLTKNFDVV
jgi:hypothetical protein